MRLKTGIVGIATAAILFSGCSSREEPKPVEMSESGLTIEQAEKIIADRQQEVIIDITRLARVIAILTEKIENIQARMEIIEADRDEVKRLEAELLSVSEKLSEMEKIKNRYIVRSRMNDEKLARLEGMAATYTEERKHLLSAEKIHFEPIDADVEVEAKVANVRSEPIVVDRTKSAYAHKGERFHAKGESDKWFELDDEKYIHKSTVSVLSINAFGRAERVIDANSTESGTASKTEEEPMVLEKEQSGAGNDPSYKSYKTDLVVENGKLVKRRVLLTAGQIKASVKPRESESNASKGHVLF